MPLSLHNKRPTMIVAVLIKILLLIYVTNGSALRRLWRHPETQRLSKRPLQAMMFQQNPFMPTIRDTVTMNSLFKESDIDRSETDISMRTFPNANLCRRNSIVPLIFPNKAVECHNKIPLV